MHMECEQRYHEFLSPTWFQTDYQSNHTQIQSMQCALTARERRQVFQLCEQTQDLNLENKVKTLLWFCRTLLHNCWKVLRTSKWKLLTNLKTDMTDDTSDRNGPDWYRKSNSENRNGITAELRSYLRRWRMQQM